LKDGQVKVVASAADGSGVTGSATINISGQVVQVASIVVTGANGATAITSKGGQLLMSADVLPANASNKAVTWSVVNTDGTQTDKATISTAGLVTAQKDGQVKVVASAADGSGVTGSATINISGQNVIITVPVTSIAVTGANGATAITGKGGQLQMVAAVTPEDANYKTVTWSVYNTDGTQTDKATISTAGLLIAAKDGQVKVVAPPGR
ncbi:Ig-like domain-containing protein, partial [Paenibacillus sp. N3.4]|uniref:Ig-like domain-containing protein n=1 Tax=Paenibacillus sp. N3.4 TaxID=2603222 RepID=UPI0011D5718E